MPNIKSAIKRVKTSRVRNLRNSAIKSSVKTAVRKVNLALSTPEADGAQVQLSAAFSALDRAARKGVIHKNAAARKKSQLSRKVNAQLASAK